MNQITWVTWEEFKGTNSKPSTLPVRSISNTAGEICTFLCNLEGELCRRKVPAQKAILAETVAGMNSAWRCKCKKYLRQKKEHLIKIKLKMDVMEERILRAL